MILNVFLRTFFVSLVFQVFVVSNGQSQSVARLYNEQLVESIRNDFARPTVHARNLFHVSAAMYDAWAIYTDDHKTVLLGDTIGGYYIDLPEIVIPDNEEELELAREETIAFAAHRLLKYRFREAPGVDQIYDELDNLFRKLGYDDDFVNTDYANDPSPAVLGNLIAQLIISFGQQDGSNELNDYANRKYLEENDPMIVIRSGNSNVENPSLWQPLAFDVFVGQSGFESPINVPEFLSPEWGDVTPFALNVDSSEIRLSSYDEMFRLYKDPGPPPALAADGQGDESDDFRYNFSLVAVWSSMMDPADSVKWDISPGSLGNIASLPTDPEDFEDLYNFFDGGDNSNGRAINPVTNQPYEPNVVFRGDYTRVLAEFWADGPDSETPPGHWFTILHTVMDHPEFQRRWKGSGEDLDELEYDVKAFVTLGGAMHDAAVATWSVKGWYNYSRPITAIRYMATLGQSSDSTLMSYDPRGLPLIPGYIELIEEADSLIFGEDEIGEIKIRAWRGPDFIQDERTSTAGVGWIRGDYWWPYQRPTFVSPPFAGYVSGHSTFSRAAAEIMTLMTGDEYFPGGVGIFTAEMDEFLVFENGPSETVELQWATYRDASDQTSLSRIWGGIHPPIDDIPGRLIGMEVATETWNKINTYFPVTASAISDLPVREDFYSLSPNPVSNTDLITISTTFASSSDVYVRLFDINGRVVRSETIRPNLTHLNIEGLQTGTYIVNLTNGEFQQVEKLIITN